MSSFPDPLPPTPEQKREPAESDEPNNAPTSDVFPQPDHSGMEPASFHTDYGAPQSYFERYAMQPIARTRFPNLLDLLLLGGMVLLGGLGAASLTALALYFHLFGVTTPQQALDDIHYTLGSQAAWYVISFVGSLLLFRAVWHTGFFRGIEWQADAAIRLRRRLTTAVFVCIILAIVDAVLLPGPKEAPIDQIFREPGAAWLLFAFGITLAPFFEEMAFRGFLLPALCTAFDWTVERIEHRPAPLPDTDGKTEWSMPAMIVASLLTSVPFALMHAEQTGYSLGPFLLLVCVSLVLCWIRLGTRSLAASTLVHACYNLLLFTFMFAGTGGFRHLDKM
jgi:membrane protease YdiL (CAAX protease family)